MLRLDTWKHATMDFIDHRWSNTYYVSNDLLYGMVNSEKGGTGPATVALYESFLHQSVVHYPFMTAYDVDGDLTSGISMWIHDGLYQGYWDHPVASPLDLIQGIQHISQVVDDVARRLRDVHALDDAIGGVGDARDESVTHLVDVDVQATPVGLGQHFPIGICGDDRVVRDVGRIGVEIPTGERTSGCHLLSPSFPSPGRCWDGLAPPPRIELKI